MESRDVNGPGGCLGWVLWPGEGLPQEARGPGWAVPRRDFLHSVDLRGGALGSVLGSFPPQAAVQQRWPETAPEHRRDQHPEQGARWGGRPRGAAHPDRASRPASVFSAPRECFPPPTPAQGSEPTQSSTSIYILICMSLTCVLICPVSTPLPLGWASSGVCSVFNARSSRCSSL